MKYLLDTCLLSELIKPDPSPKVVEWLSSQDEDHLFISVLTIGEILKEIGYSDGEIQKLKESGSL